MKITKKQLIIAAIVLLVAGIIAYWYWAKNRVIGYYYRHYKIDEMTHAELVGAVLDTNGYSYAFDDTVRTTNRPDIDAMSDDDLRTQLRKNISDIMTAAYSGN